MVKRKLTTLKDALGHFADSSINNIEDPEMKFLALLETLKSPEIQLFVFNEIFHSVENEVDVARVHEIGLERGFFRE